MVRFRQPSSFVRKLIDIRKIVEHTGLMWVVRVGGDDGELRSWYYIYVYSIESRLIMRARYDSHLMETQKVI